jgi:hypothetical protein
MSDRPLRETLLLQSVIVAAPPFFMVLALLIGVLYPQLRGDVEVHQRQLAMAIASQTESFLATSQVSVKVIAELFVMLPGSILEGRIGGSDPDIGFYLATQFDL